MKAQLTQEDSLKLIAQMINQARNNYGKGAGSYCIFWGYFIAILALLNYALLHIFINKGIDPTHASYVWLTTLPVFVIYFIYIKMRVRRENVITHIDRIIYNTWLGFGFSSFLLILILNLFGYYTNTPKVALLISPIMLLLVGLAQFISAKAMKFKPYTYASFVFWIGSVLCIIPLICSNRGDIQFIIFAACMILGFCVPGHMLNRKAKENV